MDIQLIQTSDAFRYFDIFTITSLPTRRFCELQGVKYSAYVGVKVGDQPWHATFNRIPMLLEILNSGYRGWVIYMDADAYVADVSFDVRSFLEQYEHKSILAAPGGEQDWNVNAGILFLNLGQEAGRQIVTRWAEAFENEVGEMRLREATSPWPEGLKDDQVLLHGVLGTMNVADVVERLSLGLVGWPKSRFIRQLLRIHGSFADRVAMARAGVDEVMLSAPTCS